MLLSKQIKPFLLGGLFIGSLLLFQGMNQIQSTKQQAKTSIGNSKTLVSAYERWKSQKNRQGKRASIVMPLSYAKGHSSEFTQAKGQAKLDLISGIINVTVSGLDPDASFDVWLLDKSANGTINSTNNLHIGSLQHNNSTAVLRVTLNASDLAGFELNRIVITAEKQTPEQGILLSGSPTLFQRLFYNERRLMAQVPSKESLLTTQSKKQSDFIAPFVFLLPKPAFAQAASVDIDALIAEGEDIFFNETFDGNGRTCGTCHPANNNFTIDPVFIANLPDDDPLFIAEFNEELSELENPVLLREFGLILTNLDGLEDPASKFVMRSVPHMLGMSLSIQSSATEPPLQMTGWSGDGAPGAGTLRDFTTGAVIQHYTQTLDRVEGEDFRLPTDAELDAMEAFMLSLGRQEEIDLETLILTNQDAERGRVLFLAEDSQNSTVQAAKCNICHRNAGALTLAGENANFVTGVENMPHPAALIGEVLPVDGGFGKDLNETTQGFGDGSFNTVSLWEAADTAPYFHHNGATTLEDAIKFYDSPEFKNSIEGQRLQLMDSGGKELSVETDVLAAFLRVINVLENERSAVSFMERSVGQSKSTAKKLLKLAKADIIDALQVLKQGELHKEDVVPIFKDAKSLVNSARGTGDKSARDELIALAITAMEEGKSLMVEVATTSEIDTVAPVVSISAPLNLETVSGITLISVNASDDVAIDNISFKIGTTLLGQPSNQSFIQWDTRLFANGLVSITVIVTDTSNNSTTTRIDVTIENLAAVDDTTAPLVTITNPASTAHVSGTVIITADVIDDVAVDSVVFTVGSTELGVDVIPPYEMIWDTSTFAEGLQNITVMAVDSSANSASNSVSVTIENIDITPPVVSITNLSNSQRVAGTVVIAANATDNFAVDRVVFSVGQTQLGVVSTPPSSMAWDTTTFAEDAQQISVIAVDSNNNSAEAMVTVSVDNIVTCTVYSCPNPPPTTEPSPVQIMPSSSSPDGEFETVLESKDSAASTITFSNEGSLLTLKITASTEFKGSIVSNIDELLVGHAIQGEFFQSTKEIVWIEADMPPGL